MSALDDLRAQQRDQFRYPSDADWDAFLARVEPETARLDRIAHASETEIRMLRLHWQRRTA